MQNVLFKPSELSKESRWFDEEGCRYFIIDNEEKLSRLADILRGADIIAYDIETTGLRLISSKIVGVSVAAKPGEAFYIPLNHYGNSNISFDLFYSYLKDILESRPIIGHNVKFDYKFTKKYLDIDLNIKHDTFIISKLIDEFDSCALKYLGSVLLNKDVLELNSILKYYEVTHKTFDLLKPEECYKYGCQDVDLTLRLFDHFKEEFGWEEDYIYLVEMELIKNLSEMEMRGVKVDYKFLVDLKNGYEEQIKDLSNRIYGAIGGKCNLDSSINFGAALLKAFPEVRSFMLKTEKSGNMKLDEYTCKLYNRKFQALIEDKKLDTENIFELYLKRKTIYSLLSKYVTPWLGMIEKSGSDIIYTSFSSFGAATGRMSSQNPNMQNVAPKIRHSIVPREGYYFISMDFDQVEWRIFSAVAGLEHLIEGMNKGADIHTMAASLLFQVDEKNVTKEIRKQAKTLNFGVLYGMGMVKLADSLGIDVEEAKELKKKYDARFLKNTSWFGKVVGFAKRNGYVMTSFGRKRRIDNINVSVDPWSDLSEQKQAKKLKGEAIRKAINTPIQGTSADITKIAINKIFRFLRETCHDIHPIIVVHDDVLFEVSNKYKPEDILPELKRCMEMFFKEKVWLTVDNNISTKSWGALKDG